MDPAVIVTLVVSVSGVIFASITAPLILAHRTEKMHRQDQLADYQRQDRVAIDAANTAAAARNAAWAAQRAAERSQDQLAVLNAQTRRIHTLVNSDMTAARQEQLDQDEQLIVMLQRVIQLTQDKGMPPNQDDLNSLDRIRHRRDQLELLLADRIEQAREAEIEAMKTKAGQDMLSQDKRKDPDDADPAG